nr:MAG TPA: LysW biosynthesis protein LysW [Caudoviricetes sp.]
MEKNASVFLRHLSRKYGANHLQTFYKYRNSPVCPRCLHPAYRDKGWSLNSTAACPHCGWRGSTVTLDTFIANKYYR